MNPDELIKKPLFFKIRLILLALLVLIFIFPLLKQIDFSNFLIHPIEKTDLDWYSNNVDCIKKYLPDFGTYGFAFAGPTEDSTLMTAYQLQNLFVPIVLDFNKPQDYEYTIWYLPDLEYLNSFEFNSKDIIVNCDDRLFLITN